MKFMLILFSMVCFARANASVTVSNGTVTINVSGGDAQSYSGNGSSAGSVDVTLAYADAAKTIVSITGTESHFGKSDAINQQIKLSDLKSVTIYAVGGDGGNGYDGSTGSSGQDGQDGQYGQNGSDGCPPSSGGNGSDGGNGGDGGRGGDGDDGGSGGSGGSIKVSTSPDQNELMLYVKTAVSGGDYGRAGSGGSGGSGGRAGHGGEGGRGGTNTCTDDKGNRTGGPDGSNGWSGQDGRSGNSGSNGYDGRNGGYGRTGAKAFQLVAGGNVQSFSAPFDLEITGVKFNDDSGDQILEPGEHAYPATVQVTNKGPMPSPSGQAIKVQFLASSTLLVPAPLSQTLGQIAPAGVGTLTPPKGTLVLQVPDQTALIGKKATTTARLSINNVNLDYAVDTGMSIHWPVSLTAAATKASASFEIAKTLSYTLKNVGAQALGPNSSQPVYVDVAWVSKTVPGSDVTVTLADGRVFNLAHILALSDLTVPANGTAPLNLSLLVHDSKLVSNASGTLTVSVRLQDFTTPNQNVVQSIDAGVTIGLDLKSLNWQQAMNLAADKVQCIFPGLPTQAQAIASFQVIKAAGTDKMTVQVDLPGSTPSSISPTINTTDAKMIQYYELFSGNWTAKNAVDFLNNVVAPNTPKGPWQFKSCTTAL
jgi:hypothetical protein